MTSIRGLITKTLSLTGLWRLSRKLLVRDGRFVVFFHGIAQQRYAEIPHHVQPQLTVEELHKTLRWLQTHFNFLTPEDFVETDVPGVLLTFDDGLANNYVNALPVLETFNAPAIFFVSTQHAIEPTDWLPASRAYALRHWSSVEAVPRTLGKEFWDGMDAGQLQATAKHPLITIGGHTISHPHLPECSPDVLARELIESRQWLQSITNQPIDLFAYPYGHYNRIVAEAVMSAGYRAAFADNVLYVGVPDFEIPRIGIYYADHAYLDAKLSGLYKRPI